MADNALVLAVDDEPGILTLFKQILSEHGFRVTTAGDGAEALSAAEQYRPDVILLDLSLPDMDGIEVMRHLRERANTPIIMVTGRGTDNDKIIGLQLGADDYLSKPFNPQELLARVQAVMRRSHGATPTSATVVVGDVEIDLTKRMVLRSGERVKLSRTEWLLLQTLAANAGRVVLHNELLSKVWGLEYRDELEYLRVWVSRLRKKLETDPSAPIIIRTFQGIGYLLDVDSPALVEAGRVEAS
jgi:two-component system KDP operon response regulator KdpE